MSFLAPLFFVGALSAAIPVALHLLKRHPDAHVRFAAVHFLLQAPVEHSRQRHLRELLLLALRVAALLLLALAFARPFFPAASAAAANAVVVAVDVSLSMSAPGQFENARQRARAAIDGAGAAGVVAFAETAVPASGLSADRSLALAALERLTPGASGTHYRPAVAAGVDMLGGRAGRIVIITDLQRGGWDADDVLRVPAGVRVDVVDVGVPPPNLAITDLRAVGGQLSASFANSGTEPVSAAVEVRGFTAASAASGGAASTVTVALRPGRTSVLLPMPQGRWATVRVQDAGGIAADNERFLVLDGASRARLLVVTTTGDLDHDAFYAARALTAADPGAAPSDVEGVSGAGLSGWEPSRLSQVSAVLLLSTRGLEHHGRELLSGYVRGGGGVLTAVGADIDADVLSETLGGLTVRVAPPGAAARRTLGAVDERHPVFRQFSGPASLAGVTFSQVATLRADSCDSLARFTTGEAALLECEIGRGRVLLFASDLNNQWNDFPRRATFLPFLHEATAYLAAGQQLSGYLVGHAPNGMTDPGVVELPAIEGKPARLVAINVDGRESDPARLSESEFLAALATDDLPPAPAVSAAGGADDRQPLWQYVLAALLVLLVAESAVAARIS